MSRVNGVAPSRIVLLGKRRYTNKDTLAERFGRIYRLPAAWSASGRAVLLCLADYHGGASVEEFHDRLQILSASVARPAFARALWACLRFRPDVVVVSGDAYLGLVGWLLARLSGSRLVFDIYDQYDAFNGYRKPLGFDAFRFVRRRADLLLFCAPALRARFASDGLRAPSELVVNGIEEGKFFPRPMRDCRLRLGLPVGERLVGYFGSMEPDRGVADLIQAVALLRAQGLQSVLLVCGKPDPSTPLEHSWIRYRGVVPHADMPLYLNACDVLALPYRESALMDMGASCKIAEYLACRRPMVATRTRNFLENFPMQAAELGDALCPFGDPAALAREIERQLQQPRVASAPVGMAWPDVARKALDAIDRIA